MPIIVIPGQGISLVLSANLGVKSALGPANLTGIFCHCRAGLFEDMLLAERLRLYGFKATKPQRTMGKRSGSG
jgi:hypothetical protein